MMDIRLYEKFLLMALDSKKGRFIIDSLSLNNGLAGAILLELSEINKIIIKNKRIYISDNKLTNNAIFNVCIKLINNTKRNKKPRYWIYKLGNRSSGFKKVILKDLCDKKILKQVVKEFLWGIIKINRYPVSNIKLLEQIKSELRTVALKEDKSRIDEIMLLSLMHSCKLTRILFKDKKEFKQANTKIKKLTKDIEISEAVGQTIKEIQAAILVATTSTFVSTTSQ